MEAAYAELFIDGGNCMDIEALKEALYDQLSCIKNPGENLWTISIDLSRQSWQPTPEQERELAVLVSHEQFRWGHIVPPKGERMPVFSRLEKDAGWKERFVDGQTVLIKQNLRSGQNFYTRGNAVILGDVNPGAEVVAGGSILIIGVLRGIAHAGRFGDEEKIIAALKMQPIQIRIAGHITRPPDGEKEARMFPEIARIRGGRVMIESMLL